MRQVLAALRLEDVAVMAVAAVENLLEREHFGQLRDRLRGVRVGKPQAVGATEAGVAVERDGEFARQQLGLDDRAQRAAFGFHRRAQRPAIPRQASTDALAADHERNVFARVDRRVAHQVDAVGVGASSQPDAARIDQRHEHQAQRFELALQHAVPAQPHGQAAQVGDQHLRADPFEAMDAAEKADGRDVEAGIAERHRIDRQLALADRDAADDARVEPAGAVVDQPFELGQFGDSVHHAAPLQQILNIARLG